MAEGASIEEAAGGAIECALMNPRAASRTRWSAPGGSATSTISWGRPAAWWVAETKTARVPEDRFFGVLERVAADVDAVREWAPGVPVTGGLVFGVEQARRPGPTYDCRGRPSGASGASPPPRAICGRRRAGEDPWTWRTVCERSGATTREGQPRDRPGTRGWVANGQAKATGRGSGISGHERGFRSFFLSKRNGFVYAVRENVQRRIVDERPCTSERPGRQPELADAEDRVPDRP